MPFVATVASGIVMTVALAGCSALTRGGADAAAPANQAAPSGAAQGSEPTDGSMPTTSMLMARRTKALGTIVTDHEGYTLYRYHKDMKAMSMCTGACAKDWPPLMADTIPQVRGLNRKLPGTSTREDGMKQLTIAGWPLYRYAGDTRPGVWKGVGVDDAWGAVGPTGKMVMGGTGEGMDMGGGGY